MAAKTKKTTAKEVIEKYMDYVLEQERVPKSVYKFCKEHNFEEKAFYELFGSMESVRKSIWNSFYEHTLALIEKNKDYETLPNKEKMLTFFYTFFELLTLNRSYVLFTLDRGHGVLKNMEQLKGLRKLIKSFARDLIDDANAYKSKGLTKYNGTLFSEGAWIQFLFILKFWIDDSSPGFEKTDMAIEKSINTIFDVFDNTPLERIVDFGKFLYKETFA
ncbi:TetR family transcriptional regulator C-terminal domain-containing protein [Maribacter halichondriae]|uniref:TetR family transcriptional regulator C-terminal domain-containing protein n=1 Tax=Maribacter halichondriae TaxID=2980554 RepID=UPI002359004C|nr:TetR family transcriptional regulator C-terminal domain-containing protein [Maribacter sp. Hal144]